MVRNFRKPADLDFEMLRFFGLRGCMNYDLGFLCLTRPAFTRLPWRITPCPCVHAWASLAVFIILTASKPCEIRIAMSQSAGFRKFLTLWCLFKKIRICRHLACTFWNVGYFNSYFAFILHSLVACT